MLTLLAGSTHIDLNPNAFDGHTSRCWTIFPAFFQRSV
jgi:hypothetical protein